MVRDDRWGSFWPAIVDREHSTIWQADAMGAHLFSHGGC